MTAETIVGDAGTSNAGSPGARAPFTPVALLKALDGWLAESGHDDGRPWRVSIAETLQAHDGAHPLWASVTELQDAAYNAAAVARGLDAHIGYFCIQGDPTEDDLITFARSARVAAELATKLSDRIGNLPTGVAHG